METLKDYWMSVVGFVTSQVKSIGVADVIDILLVSIMLYYAFKFIRDRRAGRLLAGVAFLIFVQLISQFFGLVIISYLLKNVFQVGLIALIVVFQPELRSALEKMGAEPLRGLKYIGEQKDSLQTQNMVNAICEAACDMSKDKTGALIVMERRTKLGEYVKSGVVVNADVSSFLLKNIFFNKAPLHDGAVIIRETRIYAAGCFLPLSTNDDIIKDLGTRHRAAIGMSENSDAVVIVVSEETGVISVAYDGQLKRNYDYKLLNRALSSEFVFQSARTTKKKNKTTDLENQNH